MGVRADDYPTVLAALARLTNLRGALVTMPHKVTTLALADSVTPTARIAGACNAMLKRADGSWLGDQFDGAGFVRGMPRKGRRIAGARAFVAAAAASARRSRRRWPPRASARSACTTPMPRRRRRSAVGSRSTIPSSRSGPAANDPAGHDIVVNATPLGMKEGDPLPFDVARVDAAGASSARS